MVTELGSRLVDAGLVTSKTLADALSTVPLHHGALVRALTERGVSADALAGFFLSQGFGPLLEPLDLEAAQAEAVTLVPSAMARAFLLLPVRRSEAGLVVAMAAPTDEHALGELRRAIPDRPRILPTVARVPHLLEALAAAYPGADDGTPTPVGPKVRADGRGRSGLAARTQARTPDGYGSSTRGAMRAEARVLLRTRDREVARRRVSEAVPLVQTKPEKVRSITQSFEREEILRHGEDEPTTAEPAWAPGGTLPAGAAPPPPAGAELAEEAPPEEHKVTVVRAKAPPRGAPGTIIPPEHERWGDLDRLPPNKVGRSHRSTVRHHRPKRPPPVGGILAAMRVSRSRDEVIELACRGARTVATSSIFLTRRDAALQGFDGAGPHLTREAVRNLWIPLHSQSVFKRVLEDRKSYRGAHGMTPVDDLFRAGVGSRGGDLAVVPVLVDNRLVGMLSVDDLRFGLAGLDRVEAVGRTLGEAFRRIIVEGRR